MHAFAGPILNSQSHEVHFFSDLFHSIRVGIFLTGSFADFYFLFYNSLVHALVYEPVTGDAKMLPTEFGSYLKELRSVYDMYKMVDDIKS